MTNATYFVITTGGDYVTDLSGNLVVVLRAAGLYTRENQLAHRPGDLYNRNAVGLYNRAGVTSTRRGGRSNQR